MKTMYSLVSVLAVGFAFRAIAQDDSAADAHVVLDLPIVDLPFNTFNNGSFPSMSQSLGLSKAAVQSLNFGVGKVLDPKATGWQGFWNRFGFIVTDSLLYRAPVLGGGWMHEEWHRAVMSRHEVDSHNGMYDHHGSLIPVNKETDEDLTRLKRESPTDQVRLAEAGMESEHEQALSIEKDHFFRGTKTYDAMQLWLLHTSPIGYLDECAGSNANTSTDKQNDGEGSNVGERDFTGLDCDGWVRDLYRPEESFVDRGVHPSGVGINRYTKWSDLTNEEQNFLKLQRDLSFLNLVDPYLIGIEQFSGLGMTRWNATLRHHLTSFGYALDVNFFFERDGRKGLAILHNYRNKRRYYPGVEMQLPVFHTIDDAFALSLRLAAWQQPKAQVFDTAGGESGGLAGGRINYTAWKKMSPFAEVEAKSPGWVAGNVFTGQNVSARIGVEAMLF